MARAISKAQANMDYRMNPTYIDSRNNKRK